MLRRVTIIALAVFVVLLSGAFEMSPALCATVLSSENPAEKLETSERTYLFEKDIDAYIEKKLKLEGLSRDRFYKFSQDEESIWRDYAREHFNTIKHVFDESKDALITLIKYSITGISIVFTAGVVLLSTQFTNLRQVVERAGLLTEEVESQNAELQTSLKRSRELADELSNELAGINEYKETLKEQYKEVFDFLQGEEKVKEKAVIWIFESERTSDYGMIKNLKNDGFENVDVWHISTAPLPSNRVKTYDLAVYSYVNSEDAYSKVQSLINFLQERDSLIPLIVYIYNKDVQVNIPNEQISILKDYGRYLISTTPTNFKSNFRTLIREPAEEGI